MSVMCTLDLERHVANDRAVQIYAVYAVLALLFLVLNRSDAVVSYPAIKYNVSAMLPVDNFTEWAASFHEALSLEASRTVVLGPNGPVLTTAVTGVKPVIVYVCDAIKHNNISAMVVIGEQTLINSLLFITRHAGIPLLGFDTGRSSIENRGERPLYLQLDPGPSLSAWAIVRILEANQWYYASLITEEGYAGDGFAESFYALTAATNKSLWRVEDHIRVSCRSNRENIDYQLLALLENQSRVIVLHASATLASIIFEVAIQNGFGDGYAWFVTEDVLNGVSRSRCEGKGHNRSSSTAATIHSSTQYSATPSSKVDFASFPAGLIAVAATKDLKPAAIMGDVVRLVAEGIRQYESMGRTSGFSGGGCWESNQRYFPDGELFYRILKKSSVPTEYGKLSFDEYGVRTHADFKIYNLIPDTHTKRKTWKVIGHIRNSSLQFSTVLWPGNRISSPPAKGRRTLRVVTAVAEPFVMEQQAFNDTCTTSVSCLRVNTKDKEMLDDIFKDFENHIHNDSHPYNVSCCKGLSIMLLERLARDLEFHIQLYVTADEQFGHADYQTVAAGGPSGTYQSSRSQLSAEPRWTGLVGDLVNGAAHMAVSAFSITRSRSTVIDFTEPYFTAGFSIVVSEQKRRPPIYAFMEPFDGWVWISIVVSATVVAVSLSIFEWNSPFGLNPWGRKRKTNYTLGSGLNMVYAILFQHTIKTKSPKSWPSKWLQNFWAGVSIFIYSSYTANLAAFLAGKNSAVVITGVHDPQLLEATTKSVLLRGTAVEDFTRQVNPRLLMKIQQYLPAVLPTETALAMLLNGTIDAYLDDTPIAEYVRTAIDAKCQLRLVSSGFGEDAYGIGLPRNSQLKGELNQKILEYHESGFMEDLMDLFFRRTRCKDHSNDGQLQGEAASMNFDQHAGLYLLLVVGIFVCVLLMFAEHAVFKWIVSYWRRKPSKSFWKSPSMMFWSQRLHRIITSEELVSPHHSAREMIEVMKNRDFAKLFQKSVRKQEKMARNRKNLFNVVEQLKWKNRPSDDNAERGESSANVLAKSISVDVLHSSGVVPDSPYQSVVALPCSASTDEVDRLRTVSPLLGQHHIDVLSAKRRQSSLGHHRAHQLLMSSTSTDNDPYRRSPTSRHSAVNQRRSVDAVTRRASPSPSSPLAAPGGNCHEPQPSWHIWYSAKSRAHQRVGQRVGIRPATSGKTEDIVSDDGGDARLKDTTSSVQCPYETSADQWCQSSAVARRLANEDVSCDIKDRCGEPLAVSRVKRVEASRSAPRGLSNGVVCGSYPTSTPPSTCHDVIVERAMSRGSAASTPPGISTVGVESSTTPGSRWSSTTVAAASNFNERRRRTTDDSTTRRARDSATACEPLNGCEAVVDPKHLLDRVTKEELLEMWRSSEKALSDQLKVACDQCAELQRQLLQQQSTPIERMTVT